MNNGEEPHLRVLIVEDTDYIYDGMMQELERHGYHALRARNDEEAVGTAERAAPYLLLTEEGLPTILSLTRRFREHPQLRDVPIVIINPDEQENTRYGEIVVLTDYDQLAVFIKANPRCFERRWPNVM